MSEHKDKTGEQLDAEAEVEDFKEDLGPFVVAAEATRMAMIFTDAKAPANPIIFANDSFLRLTGYDRAEVLGQNFEFLMAQSADAVAEARIEAEFAGKAAEPTEALIRRKDGSEFWAAVLISPVQNKQGEITQYFASLVDLSRHKDEQDRCKMLIDELNHRVKNTLATVQSIASQALRSHASPEVIRQSIESRLFALARSHDLLAQENWSSAGLLDLIRTALKPFGVMNGRAEHFLITGENVRLAPNTALALGIAFHELATNAVKYGAFSNEVGSVSISWTIERSADGDRLRLFWQERGGPQVQPPTRKGFGSRVIERGLGHELGATTEMDFRSSGLVCLIDFPLPQAIHGE